MEDLLLQIINQNEQLISLTERSAIATESVAVNLEKIHSALTAMDSSSGLQAIHGQLQEVITRLGKI